MANRVTMTVTNDGACVVSPRNIGRSGELGIGMTVNVDATLATYGTGKYTYIQFITPDGQSFYKGDYDCSSGTFDVVMGDSDIMLLLDGNVDVQLVISDTVLTNLPVIPNVVLTGNAVVGDVALGKTFYSTDPLTKKTGTNVPLDTSSATAAASDIIYPKTAFINGVETEGTLIKNPEDSMYLLSPNTVGYLPEFFWSLNYALDVPEGDIANCPSDIKFFCDPSNYYSGDIASFPDNIVGIHMIDNTKIVGDLASLTQQSITTLYLTGCSNLTGVYPANAGVSEIHLVGTSMSASDTDNTLIALAAITELAGNISIIGNRTSASDAAVVTLTNLTWNITEGA